MYLIFIITRQSYSLSPVEKYTLFGASVPLFSSIAEDDRRATVAGLNWTPVINFATIRCQSRSHKSVNLRLWQPLDTTAIHFVTLTIIQISITCMWRFLNLPSTVVVMVLLQLLLQYLSVKRDRLEEKAAHLATNMTKCNEQTTIRDQTIRRPRADHSQSTMVSRAIMGYDSKRWTEDEC
jgi:hypothetical protein